jgi:hypothetical protein
VCQRQHQKRHHLNPTPPTQHHLLEYRRKNNETVPRPSSLAMSAFTHERARSMQCQHLRTSEQDQRNVSIYARTSKINERNRNKPGTTCLEKQLCGIWIRCGCSLIQNSLLATTSSSIALRALTEPVRTSPVRHCKTHSDVVEHGATPRPMLPEATTN